MFWILGLARRPHVPIIASFAQWLNRERPWLLSQLDHLPTGKITGFRNREDHANIRIINANEAEAMSSVCRGVINLLQRKPS
jgi:uncharacterized protein Smg (DUF494 family)